jgi:hypothetical protein
MEVRIVYGRLKPKEPTHHAAAIPHASSTIKSPTHIVTSAQMPFKPVIIQHLDTSALPSHWANK